MWTRIRSTDITVPFIVPVLYKDNQQGFEMSNRQLLI
jgi:hypothetical protein